MTQTGILVISFVKPAMEMEVMYTPSGRVRTSFGYSANGSLTFTSTNPNGFIANNALKNNTKVLVELIGSLSLVCVSAISYSGLVVKKRKIK